MEIPEIKQKLTIDRVLQHYGLEYDKNHRMHCPFHPDKTPSMQVYPETNTVYCFSTNCPTNGKSLDTIDFIMFHEKTNKHNAILKAQTLLNGNYIEHKSSNNLTMQSFNNLTIKNIEILTKIFNYFRNGFISRKENKARNYLQNRNLDVNKLESLGISIGYNSAQFHHRGRISTAEMQECEKAGLLIPSKNGSISEFSYTTWSPHCVIFPLTDKNGNITGMYGRRADTDNKNKHYYLKNSKGLFYYPKKDTAQLIVTESIIDFLTLYQIDEIRNKYDFLPIYGTNRLTEEHKIIIQELKNLDEIIFFFDGDEAGRKAAEKYTKEFSKDERTFISVVECPEGEDINSLLDAHEPEILSYLIENRTPASKDKTPVSKDEPTFVSNVEEPIIKLSNQQISTLNTANPDYITFTTDELQLTILGGLNLTQLDRMRITLKINPVQTNGRSSQYQSLRNNIDLYNHDQTEKFIDKAAEKLEISTKTIEKAIQELTDKLENYRLSKIEALKPKLPEKRKLTDAQKQKAINYLKQKDLLKRTNQDIEKCGIVGEENNRLLMYLVFTSRLREQPLHIISLGSSGTGKTYLQEKIAELIPEDNKLEITILSENAFYYFDKTELKNKLVLIEDMDGAENVLYPLRELQSKRKISKTIPIKDPKGNLKTITLQVEGPICLAGTTTKERLYEDNANRSLLIYLDNSKEHRDKIMEYQRKLSAGKINRNEEQKIKEFLKDIQTVLKPVAVRNPFAEQLKIPDYVFKPLRTNSHYLAFIETVTFYHQYQRRLVTADNKADAYIETTLEDIELANNLIKDVLLAKSDELSKQLRDFFEQLKKWLKKEKKESFYSKELQERLRIYPMKINRYIRELESRSFIKKVGGNRKQGFEYEVNRWDDYKNLKEQTNILDNILQELKNQQQK